MHIKAGEGLTQGASLLLLTLTQAVGDLQSSLSSCRPEHGEQRQRCLRGSLELADPEATVGEAGVQWPTSGDTRMEKQELFWRLFILKYEIVQCAVLRWVSVLLLAPVLLPHHHQGGERVFNASLFL